MLAMKGTRGTTFSYGANYWTTTNTLNTGDNTRNDADAKYDTFNYFPATDCMAIFPDAGTNGGDLPGSIGTGWVWVENNAFGVSMPVSRWFSMGVQLAKLSNGVIFGATNPIPMNSPKYNAAVWSRQEGFQWYGFNYKSSGYSGAFIRWGWAWNNEADQTSNDYWGGIGFNLSSPNNYSAGDYGNPGVNRSMRFEWWVR
jgi:hypothetical protein